MPYASDAYRGLLEDQGIVCSMSRRGDCWDNAVAESFFGRLKVELVGDTIWATRAAAQRDVATRPMAHGRGDRPGPESVIGMGRNTHIVPASERRTGLGFKVCASTAGT